MIFEFNGIKPVIDPSSFIHSQANVTGNVVIGKNVYVGPGAAIRGDFGKIIIKDGANVQENCTIHMFPGETVIINEGAHLGHGCIVHGATIGCNSLIGMNAVILEGKPVGESILQGEGAGPGPTSSSLLSDLLEILRGNIKNPFGVPTNKRKSIKCYNLNNYSNSLYLRFEVNDKPGVLSKITNRLAKYKISVKRLIQTPDKKANKATIVIITHKTTELNFKNCLSKFQNDKDILKYPTLIRIHN